jgi:hypothetical protein
VLELELEVLELRSGDFFPEPQDRHTIEAVQLDPGAGTIHTDVVKFVTQILYAPTLTRTYSWMYTFVTEY